MKVLAFDTSSKALAIAILEDDKLLAEMTVNIKKNHSVTLMPAIDSLMESLNLKPSDLGCIVVAEGPGSYPRPESPRTKTAGTGHFRRASHQV